MMKTIKESKITYLAIGLITGIVLAYFYQKYQAK
jgi:hypothetical protein